MLVYMPAPWILWVYIYIYTHLVFRGSCACLRSTCCPTLLTLNTKSRGSPTSVPPNEIPRNGVNTQHQVQDLDCDDQHEWDHYTRNEVAEIHSWPQNCCFFLGVPPSHSNHSEQILKLNIHILQLFIGISYFQTHPSCFIAKIWPHF